MEAKTPLYQIVVDMAAAAATQERNQAVLANYRKLLGRQDYSAGTLQRFQELDAWFSEYQTDQYAGVNRLRLALKTGFGRGEQLPLPR